MKIDFSKQLVDTNDEPMFDPVTDETGRVVPGKKGKPVTLYAITRMALFASEKDGNMTMTKAMECGDIYRKLTLLTPVDLKAEEVVLIKQRVESLRFPPGVMWQVNSLLEEPKG